MGEAKVTYACSEPGRYALKHDPRFYNVAVPLFWVQRNGGVKLTTDHSAEPHVIPVNQTAEWSPQ